MVERARSGERFEPIGLVDLKGLPDPVAVCEVRWEPAVAEEASPLPSALAETAGFPFAGRGEVVASQPVRRLLPVVTAPRAVPPKEQTRPSRKELSA